MAQFANMFEVDLNNRSYPVSLVQTVSEGNVYANRIGTYVYKDGAPVNLGGACTGLVMRADGTTVPLTGYVEGNAAYVVLDQPSCAIPGPIQVAVNSVVGENITTLLVAYGTVIQTDTRNYVEPGTPIPDITELLAEIDNMREATAAAEAAATNALANFAGAFVAATAYPSGTYVTYTDGYMYILPDGHEADVTWANTTKTRVTVGGEVDDLNSALDYLKEDQLPRYIDHYIVLTGIEKKEFSIPAGILYTIDTIDGRSFPSDNNFVDFYDSNGTRIDYAGFNSSIPNPRTLSYDGLINNPRVCLRFNSNVPIVIKYSNSNKISSVVDKYIEYLEEAGVVAPNDLEAETTGYYINNDGTTTANADYKISKPIQLKKNDILVVTCQAASGNVSVISERVQYIYRPLVISDETAVKTYTYQAEKDINVKVCCVWKKENSAIVIKPTPEEKQTIPYTAIFHRIGVIGDSLSSGELTYQSGGQWHFVDKYEYSWLSNIARTLGIEKAHYSQGGYTAKDFVENIGGHKTRLLNDTACNAYYIALGTNDKNQSYPLGTISDTKDTNSFVGYMKNIIDVVHTKAPNAVIFLLSTYNDWNDDNVSYSEMIEDISELYDYCFYLDFQKESGINTQTEGIWSAGGHFSTAGYVYVANVILGLTNKAVLDNGEYFFYFALNN